MDSAPALPLSRPSRATTTPPLALWLSLLIGLMAVNQLNAGPVDAPRDSSWWRLQAVRDLHGKKIELKSRWLVVIFFGQECPVSNAAIVKLNRLSAEFAPRGFALIGAYVDPTADLPALCQHAQDFGITFPVADDREQRLARLARATVTPEAVVFSSDGRKFYQGRIDDRVGEGGLARSTALHEDLRDVLTALAAGQTGPFPSHPGYGCALPQAIPR